MATRLRRTILLAGIAAFWLALALPARADERRDVRIRAALGGGLVLSADQLARIGLDLPVLEGQLRAGWFAADVLVLELALTGGAFLASAQDPGALVDLTLGAEVGVEAGAARPWLSLHVGAGLTGSLVRPVMRIAAGVDVAVSPELALGPALAYGHVFQEDGRGFTDDAQYLAIALTLTFRPVVAAPVRVASARVAPPRVVLPLPPPRPPHAPPLAPSVPAEELMALIDEAAGTRPRELLVPVLFAYDSTEIVACSLPALHALREHLAAHAEILVLEIEGHADGSGSDAYNDALSLRRAEAIREWLLARGIAAERLRVSARGERAPVEPEDDDAARAQNRRARFRVLSEQR